MSADGINCLCMAAKDGACDFKPMEFKRRALLPNDVLIEMRYCGICHTDLHSAAGHAAAVMPPKYPAVPGHELAGVCTEVGSAVTKFKVGDHVGVGCMVDSCGSCGACVRGEEQMCMKQVGTYGAADRSGRAAYGPDAPQHTLGGYTSKFVVHENFGIKIPKEYPLEAAGPVMCAGITMFDPLKRYEAGAGTRVGIVGVGGLGQMGIKLAKALGCVVTAVTSNASKAEFCRRCGADDVVVSTDAAQMLQANGKLDLILNTIPSEHDYYAYNALLASKGKQVILGLHSGLVAGFAVDAMCCGRSKVKGSGIGSIANTQAVIDLCAQHKIYPDLKVVPVWEINRVYEQLEKSNVSGERFVVDLSTLSEAAVKCNGVAPPALNDTTKPMGMGILVGGICGLLCSCRWC